MPAINTIFFDLGGTLLYPDFSFLQLHFQRHHHSVDHADYLRALSKASTRLDTFMQHRLSTDASRVPVYIQYLLEELNAPFDIPTFIQQEALPHHRRVSFWNYLQEGTLDLLERLRKTHRLGLISNSDGRAEAKCRQYGLLPYLELVLDSQLVGIEKPEPGIFQIACSTMKISPEECAYVGDIYSIDVLGAKAAGLHPILIDHTRTPRPDCQVIGSLFELERVV